MAWPGVLARERERIEGVVVGQDLGERRCLAGQLKGVENVGEAISEEDRGAVGDLEMQVGSSRGA